MSNVSAFQSMGIGRSYNGKVVQEPFKRKSGLEPLNRITCPRCEANEKKAVMNLLVAKQYYVRDRLSPNYKKEAKELRFWCCDSCNLFVDAWDGWEIPDDLRHNYYRPFHRTIFGRIVIFSAIAILVAAFAK